MDAQLHATQHQNSYLRLKLITVGNPLDAHVATPHNIPPGNT